MNTKRRGIIYAACAALISALAAVPAAGASATPFAAEPHVSRAGASSTSPSSNVIAEARAVQVRYLDGTQTAADVSWVKQNPEISKWILDPSKSTLRIVSSTRVPNTHGASPLSDYCTSDGYAGDEYGAGGMKLYTYFSHVKYCMNATRITSIPEHTAYFTDINGGINVVSNMLLNQASMASNNGYVTHEGHAQYCVTPYGCLFNYYPKITWTLYPWSPATAVFTH